VPGDPNDHTGTELNWHHEEGFLVVSELGVILGQEDSWFGDIPYGKYAFGSWIYTANFDDQLWLDLNEEPIRHAGNLGFYFLAEQTLFQEKEDSEQGLAAFFRFGWAEPDFNDVEFYTGGGTVYTGLFPGRPRDQIGVAVGAAQVGEKFKLANRAEGIFVHDAEINIEATYLVEVFPWLAIQPNFQAIIHPGFNPLLQDAAVFGTRWIFTIW